MLIGKGALRMGATENLAKNLRTLRAIQGCSLVHYAQQLDISKSTLQEIEHGHPPNLDTVECIARNLNIPVSVLLSDAFTSDQSDQVVKLLLKLDWYSSWTPQDREKLLSLCTEIVRLLNKYPPRHTISSNTTDGM